MREGKPGHNPPPRPPSETGSGKTHPVVSGGVLLALALSLAGSLRPLARRRVEIRFKRYSLVLQDSFKMSRDYLYTTPVPLDSSEEYEFLWPANISIRKQNRGGGSAFPTGTTGGQRWQSRERTLGFNSRGWRLLLAALFVCHRKSTQRTRES